MASSPSNPAAPLPHEANLRTTVDASYELIGNQYETSAGIQVQLIGLLSVFVAAGSLFALAHHPLHAERWLLLVGDALAIATCVAGLFLADLRSGPVPRLFYEKYGSQDPHDYLDELSRELDRAAERNQGALDKRQAALALAIFMPLAWGAIWVFVQLVVK